MVLRNYVIIGVILFEQSTWGFVIFFGSSYVWMRKFIDKHEDLLFKNFPCIPVGIILLTNTEILSDTVSPLLPTDAHRLRCGDSEVRIRPTFFSGTCDPATSAARKLSFNELVCL